MRIAVFVAMFTIAAASLGIAQSPGGKPAAEGPAPAGTEILNDRSYCRWRRVTHALTFADASGPVAPPADFMKEKPPLSPNPEDAPPPAGWTAAEFDDSAWPRMRPGAESVADGRSLTEDAFRVCMRWRFMVSDPVSAGELTLGQLQFSGGVVVYLNGREVARAFLPEGPLTDDTAATAYGDDAWPPAGRGPVDRNQAARDAAARETARTRTIGPVRLPADAVRKGVNVLAIDLRRSPSHPRSWQQWQAINFASRSFSLRATGAGVVANTSRPKGLRVWIEDINDRLTERDWGDPCEPLRPLRIVAARNGSFSGGLIVVSSTSPLKGVTATVSDLKSAGGGATIPAAAAELFTLQSDGRGYARTNWFDGLKGGVPADSPVLQITPYAARPIPDAAMLPVYLRLNVPKDAAPGEYRGSVTISVAGEQPVVVPVETYVSAFTLRDPKDYRTYVGLYESPTSVALQYKVAEWSEPHWKYLEKSFALLGRAGNKMINACVVDKTQFGNEEGMVYWIRKADGTFDYDFTQFDRLVALAMKHFGTLDYVALQIWHSGGWETRKADQENTVTVIDPETKKREHLQVPAFDSPEARTFWRPFLARAREHLAKVGLEKAMCIGILSDGTAPPEVFKMFDEIWPGGGPALWTRGLHTQRSDMKPYRADRGGGLVVLHEHCYGTPIMTVAEPITGLAGFRGAPVTAYFRFSGFETVCTINGYRLLTDRAIFLRKQGIGRIGFDFWDVLPTRREDYGANIYNRYPQSSCAQRAPALYTLCWPGPEGAETTQRFEALCQGVQETEAMLAVSAALDKPGANVTKEQADRARKVLYDRLWFVTTRPMTAQWSFMLNHVNHFGWQELARRTFDSAAEMGAK